MLPIVFTTPPDVAIESVSVLNRQPLYAPGDNVSVNVKLNNRNGGVGTAYKISYALLDVKNNREFPVILTRDSGIGAGESQNFTQLLKVPDIGLSRGDYSVAVRVAVQRDANTSNNFGYDNQTIVVSPADLSLDSLQVPREVYRPGDRLEMTTLVTNEGFQASGTFKLDLYVADAPDLGNAIEKKLLHAEANLPELGYRQSERWKFTGEIPQDYPEGTYYVIGVLTCTRDKNPENNENYADDPLEVELPPQVEVSAVKGGPDDDVRKLTQGDVLHTDIELSNPGNTRVDEYWVGIYLSTDGTITEDDVLISELYRPDGLAGNDQVQLSFDDPIPQSTPDNDRYYIGARVEWIDRDKTYSHSQYDPISVEVSQPDADLAVTSVSVPINFFPVGSLILPFGIAVLPLDFEVENKGGKSSGGWTFKAYASVDRDITANDVPLIVLGGENYELPAISPERSYSTLSDYSRFKVVAPFDMEPGLYYVGIVVSCEQETELSDNANSTENRVNFFSLQSISIADPVLESVDATNGSFAPGGHLPIHVAIRNDGFEASGPVVVQFFLSQDQTLTQADIALGAFERPSLGPQTLGDPSLSRQAFDASMNLPGTIPRGQYYVFAAITCQNDSKPEASSNIKFDSTPITIENKPDIGIDELLVLNASLSPGSVLKATTKIRNHGGETSDFVDLNFFLVPETTSEIGEPLATFHRPALSAGAFEPVTSWDIPIPAGTNEGSYRLLARTTSATDANPANNMQEADKRVRLLDDVVSITVNQQSWNSASKELSLLATATDSETGLVSSGTFTWSLATPGGTGIAQGALTFDSATKEWSGTKTLPSTLSTGNYVVVYVLNLGNGRSGTALQPLIVQRQITVKGRVTDGFTKQPIANAQVTVGGSSVQTSDIGSYVITGVDTATAPTISASKSGFASYLGPMIVDPGSDIVERDIPLYISDGLHPVVTSVMPKDKGILLGGLALKSGYTANVNWTGTTPGYVKFLADGLEVQRVEWTSNMVGIGAKAEGPVALWFSRTNQLPLQHELQVIAVSNDGIPSNPYSLPVLIAPVPFLFQKDIQNASFTADALGIEPAVVIPAKIFEWLDRKVEVPFLGIYGPEARLNLELAYKIRSGEWSILANGARDGEWKRGLWGASNLYSNDKFLFYLSKGVLTLAPNMKVGGVVSQTKGFDWDSVKGSVGLAGGISDVTIQKFKLTDTFPATRLLSFLDWAGKRGEAIDSWQSLALQGSLTLAGNTSFKLSPLAFDTMTVQGQPDLKLAYKPTIPAGSVELAIGGTGGVTADLMPRPLIKSSNFKIYASASYKSLLVEKKWEYAFVDWNYPATSAKGGRTNQNDSQILAAAEPNWRVLSREYLRKGGAPTFVATPLRLDMALQGPDTISKEDENNIDSGGNGKQKTDDAKSEVPAPTFVEAKAATSVATTLIQNVFPEAHPALASRAGEHLLLYASDNGATNSLQRTDINWMRFNGTGWSSPLPILTDTRAEFSPAISYDGQGNAVAVWQRVKSTNFNSQDPDLMAAQLEIVWSRWNRATNAWSSPLALTDNAYLDGAPRLAGPMADGSVLLVWKQNASNLQMGTGYTGENSNSIVKWSKWNSSAQQWSAPTTLVDGLTFETSETLAGSGTSAVFAWTRDADGNLKGSKDQDVWYVRWNGSTWTSPALFTDPQQFPDSHVHAAVTSAGTAFLVWEHDSDLVVSKDFGPISSIRTSTSQIGFKDASFSVGGNGKLALMWSEPTNTATDLRYAVWDPVSDEWSADRVLSNDLELESQIFGTWDSSGNVIATFVRNQVTAGDVSFVPEGETQPVTFTSVPKIGRADLVFVSHGATPNLRLDLKDAALDATGSLPGDMVKLSVTAENDSDVPLSGVSVALFDGDPLNGGREIARQSIQGSLKGGESARIKFDWMIPVPASPHVLFAVVDPGQAVSESREEDNELSFPIGGTDLNIDMNTADAAADGSGQIIVDVQNLGAPASGATTLVIRRKADGSPNLASTPVPAIDPGHSIQAVLTLPKDTLPVVDESFTVVLDPQSASSDVDRTNNSFSTSLARADRTAPPALVITTNSGRSFRVGISPVLIEGSCSPDTVKIRVNGRDYWHTPGETHWEVKASLANHENTLSCVAIDAAGNVSSPVAISVYLDSQYDSDADGILDRLEGSRDTDRDGIPNYLDLDSDANGISDADEGIADLDGDKLPAFMDADNDGDGYTDVEEIQSGALPDDSNDHRRFLVTTLEDGAPDLAGSLRWAILQANSLGATNKIPSEISFSRRLKGGYFELNSALPSLTASGIKLNGDIDADGGPDIKLDGQKVTSGHGLIVKGSNCTIQGFTVSGFPGDGIQIEGTDSLVTHCIVGIDPKDPLRTKGNGGAGIAVQTNQIEPGVEISQTRTWGNKSGKGIELRKDAYLFARSYGVGFGEYEPAAGVDMCTDGRGGAWYVWTTQSSAITGRDIYATRIQTASPYGLDMSTQFLFPFVVCEAEGDQTHPKISPDGQGGVFVVWEDRFTLDADIFAQHLDQDGMIIGSWGSDGFPVCTAVGDQLAPRIAEDGAGGAVVTWIDQREFDTVYAMRIDTNGFSLWDSDGKRVTDRGLRTQNRAELCAVPDGVVFFWLEPGQSDGRVRLKTQKLSYGGQMLWGGNGKTISGPDVIDLSTSASSSGEVYCSFVEGDSLAKIVRLDSQGVIEWSYEDQIDGVSADPGLIVPDSTSVFYLRPQDSKADVQSTTIPKDARLISLDSSTGKSTWSANLGAQTKVLAISDNRDGVIVMRHRPSAPLEFDVQRYDSKGISAWLLDGVPIQTGYMPSSPEYPLLIGDGMGGALASWSIDFSAWDPNRFFGFYAHHVTSQGVLDSVMPELSHDGKKVSGFSFPGSRLEFYSSDLAPVDQFGLYNGQTYIGSVNADETGVVEFSLAGVNLSHKSITATTTLNGDTSEFTLVPALVTGGPTVQVTQAAGQGDPAASQPIQFTVNFSEPVTGFDALDIVLGGISYVPHVAVSGFGSSYTISIDGLAGVGRLSLTIPANAAHNASGVGNEVSAGGDNSVAFLLPWHSADTDRDQKISALELGQVVALFNAGEFHSTSNGFEPGPGSHDGATHSADFISGTAAGHDWRIDAQELDRVVQYYRGNGYQSDIHSPDGFALR